MVRERGTSCVDAAARAAADRREQIRPVLAYVDRHCHESITLEDVAEVVHVSPSRVRHVFKDVTGVGFKEHVTNVRLAEAKRLLLSTDLSVAEIARAVSYTNLHQFYRVFYRSCAMSPGEYRRYYTPAGAARRARRAQRHRNLTTPRPAAHRPQGAPAHAAPAHVPLSAGGAGHPHRDAGARGGSALRARGSGAGLGARGSGLGTWGSGLGMIAEDGGIPEGQVATSRRGGPGGGGNPIRNVRRPAWSSPIAPAYRGA